MKLRDASNVLKTVSAVHMRDAANVLRAVPAIHMRDAVNVLKSAFAAGGGGAAPVTIAPTARNTSSHLSFENTSDFTATFTATPSSIVWSIEDEVNGTGDVVMGQGSAIASVRLVASDFGGDSITASCTIRCTAIMGGVTYSATATKRHTFIYRDPRDGGGPLP